MTLADALDAERQRQEMSVNGLARKAEESPSRVHAILTGGTPNPGILTVLAITRALGKSLGWLERSMRT
jgi:transcriptional regulator with XRE-family HTH domain